MANTPPDDGMKAMLSVLKSFEDTGVFLYKALGMLGGILGAAGGLRWFAWGTSKIYTPHPGIRSRRNKILMVLTGTIARILMKVLSEDIFRAEYNRVFTLFVTDSVREGAQLMSGGFEMGKRVLCISG
jgi:hypothetical protein